ncbi:MAG: class I SAM-dependent methyltransferase [Proteobacteria bacterium]|nr:class I SAM-dependent methyltransferase [Pseudomonadota bacterium]
MKQSSHASAKASHYNKDAKDYDAFNEANSQVINKTIEKILKKHKVKNVLDLTCGTGSQVFWLADRGFEVCGVDINANMLKVAKKRAQKTSYKIKFLKGDMRTTKLGLYDAVITIFNAVGHLTKADFEKAMKNINRNLKAGGLYVFDINNLNYLLKGNNITSLTIDWQTIEGNYKSRAIQYSTIDQSGILASYTTSYSQKGNSKPKILEQSQTLQTYSAKQLKEMLQRNGFKVLGQYGIDGTKFIDDKSDRILMVAKKNREILT